MWHQIAQGPIIWLVWPYTFVISFLLSAEAGLFCRIYSTPNAAVYTERSLSLALHFTVPYRVLSAFLSPTPPFFADISAQSTGTDCCVIALLFSSLNITENRQQAWRVLAPSRKDGENGESSCKLCPAGVLLAALWSASTTDRHTKN